MTIYDKTEMVGRTNIEQMNKLFNMGSELESLVDGNSGDITAIELDIDDIQGDIADIEDELDDKQDTLVSGTNIKTINGESLLGSSDIELVATVDDALSSTSDNPVENRVIKVALDDKQDTLVSGTNIKTINGNTLLGSGDLSVLTSVTWDDVTGKPTFATVATTGDYDDLENLPSVVKSTVGTTQPSEGNVGDFWFNTSTSSLYICTDTTPTWTLFMSGSGATVNWGNIAGTISNQTDLISLLNNYALSSSLATVATTGAYSDLTGTPSLSTVATTGSYNDLSNKPDLSVYAESSNLATVATSGSYSDLTNKPTIDSTIDGTSTNAVQNTVISSALDGKLDSADYTHETWTFTLDDDSTVTKEIVLYIGS